MHALLREIAQLVGAHHAQGRDVTRLVSLISHDRIHPLVVVIVAANGALTGAARACGHPAWEAFAAFNVLCIVWCGVLAAAGVFGDIDSPRTATTLGVGAVAGALVGLLLELVAVVAALYGAVAAYNVAAARRLLAHNRLGAGAHGLAALAGVAAAAVFIGGMLQSGA